MQEKLLLILGLLFVVLLLVLLAQKLRIAYPIFLVLAGLARNRACITITNFTLSLFRRREGSVLIAS